MDPIGPSVDFPVDMQLSDRGQIHCIRSTRGNSLRLFRGTRKYLFVSELRDMTAERRQEMREESIALLGL